MTTTALVNITNQVVNLGIRMVKSLSVDNISAGWDKYGQKTTKPTRFHRNHCRFLNNRH